MSLQNLIKKRIAYHWRGRGLSLSEAQRAAKTETLKMFLESSKDLPLDQKIENLRLVLMEMV